MASGVEDFESEKEENCNEKASEVHQEEKPEQIEHEPPQHDQFSCKTPQTIPVETKEPEPILNEENEVNLNSTELLQSPNPSEVAPTVPNLVITCSSDSEDDKTSPGPKTDEENAASAAAPAAAPATAPAAAPAAVPAIEPSTAEQEHQQESSSRWSSWGNWGASIISSASKSVSKFSSEVSEGLNVMVDSDLKQETGQEEEPHEKQPEPEKQEENNSNDSSILNFFSSAGRGLVEGSLTVLEKVGKKTMDIINENDPGLNITKNYFFEKKGKLTLSQLLKEGKEEREKEAVREEDFLEAQKFKLDYWFEELQGLVHLEALEILSGQSEAEVVSILGPNPEENLKSDLLRIKEAFLKEEDGEEEESQESNGNLSLSDSLETHIANLGVQVNLGKVVAVRDAAHQAVKDFEATHIHQDKISSEPKEDSKKEDPKKEDQPEEEVEREVVQAENQPNSETPENPDAVASDLLPTVAPPTANDPRETIRIFHQTAMKSVGEVVARSVELLHKTVQMMLMTPAAEAVAVAADSELQTSLSKIHDLSRVFRILTSEVDLVSARFGQALTQADGKMAGCSVNEIITDVFLESSHGCSYLKEAFKLTLPVVQRTHLTRNHMILGADDEQC